MARFDQAQLLDRLADRGALEVETMEPLAAAVRRSTSRPAAPRSRRQRRDALGHRGNAAGLSSTAVTAWTSRPCQRALPTSRRAGLPRRAARPSTRGRLRPPVPRRSAPARTRAPRRRPDAVRRRSNSTTRSRASTSATISAFLLMDLWRRGLRTHANALLNGYLAGRWNSMPGALPLFLSCRAAIAREDERHRRAAPAGPGGARGTRTPGGRVPAGGR